MTFDKDYKSRKDWRKCYYKSKRFDRSCRPGGSCPWCQGNRQHSTRVRELRSKDQMKDK